MITITILLETNAPPPFSPCYHLYPNQLLIQHQQQVAVAVERAKQITMAELNAVMQVCGYDDRIHLLAVCFSV